MKFFYPAVEYRRPWKLATLAAGICHEMKNPLQIIKTHAEFLPKRYDDPVFRANCSKALSAETRRINDLLKQLMDFARPKSPKLQPLVPHDVLDSTLAMLNSEFIKRNIRLEKQLVSDGTKVKADSGRLRQVILNLILNALEAIGKDGAVRVRTSLQDGWFILDVSDTGPGIDPKILPKLFEPFSTSKPEGNGLGLSIVHSIVREHGGKISVESKRGQGACFQVKLPLCETN